MSGQDFSFAAAEELLGPQVMAEARRQAAAAPPLRPELREQIRAVFVSARSMQPQAPAADAA